MLLNRNVLDSFSVGVRSLKELVIHWLSSVFASLHQVQLNPRRPNVP